MVLKNLLFYICMSCSYKKKKYFVTLLFDRLSLELCRIWLLYVLSNHLFSYDFITLMNSTLTPNVLASWPASIIIMYNRKILLCSENSNTLPFTRDLTKCRLFSLWSCWTFFFLHLPSLSSDDFPVVTLPKLV